MKRIIKHKWIIIIAALWIVVLGFLFWYGGSAPGLQGWTASEPTFPISDTTADENLTPGVTAQTPDAAVSPEESMASASESPSTAPTPTTESTPVATTELSAEPSPEASATPSAAPGTDSVQPLTPEEKIKAAEAMAGGSSSEGIESGDAGYSAGQGMNIDPNTNKDQYQTEPVPEGKPIPVEPQDAVITDNAGTCTLSVRCDTILDNIDWLDPEKVELVPADGVIFPATQVTFYEGESVFNVLLREMKKAGIHMEYVNVTIYNSAYIEGINNLYEFDCGELSGWMYKVNDWFPNYGCSRYQLKDGDIVEWAYTCSLGVDVGGYYSVGS